MTRECAAELARIEARRLATTVAPPAPQCPDYGRPDFLAQPQTDLRSDR